MQRIVISREKRGLGYPEAAKIVRRAVKAALKAQGIGNDCLVSVLLTDDEGVRRINREQRGLDSATDVLSFPMNELTAGAFDPDSCEYDYENECLLLGDMALSLERCAAQAVEYGHSFERELSYLTIHSVLHLLGYDHLDEGKEKRKMREQEEKALLFLKNLDVVHH